MSNKQNKNRDPVKRAAKRAAQREARKRVGDEALRHKGQKGTAPSAQMTHGSSNRANKKRTEGQAKMEADRDWSAGS